MEAKVNYHVGGVCPNCKHDQRFTFPRGEGCHFLPAVCEYCGQKRIFHLVGPYAAPDEQPAGMTFMQAVEAMKAGKRATRESWPCEYIYATSQGFLFRPREEPHIPYAPTVKDVCATDWEILK